MESLIYRFEWNNNQILFSSDANKNLLRLYVNSENQSTEDILQIDSIVITIGGAIMKDISGEQLMMHNMMKNNILDLQIPAIKSTELFYHTLMITCKMKSDDLPFPIIEMIYDKVSDILQRPSEGLIRGTSVLCFQKVIAMSTNHNEDIVILPFMHPTFQIAVAFFDDGNKFLPPDIVNSIQLELNDFPFLKEPDKNNWLYLDKLIHKITIDKKIPVFTLTFETPNTENKKNIFTLSASKFNLKLKIKWSELKTGNVRIVISSCSRNEMLFFGGMVGLKYAN